MLSSRKRKSQIEADLERNPNDSRYRLVSPSMKKSSIWTCFEQIEFEGKLENFARCKFCKELLCCSSKTGTGSLLRHKCSKGNNSNVAHRGIRIKKLPTRQIHFPRFEPQQQVQENSITEFKQQQVNFIVKDLRPLDILEGEAFQNFCQSLINVGAQHGRQNAKSILSSQGNQAKNLIRSEYERIKNELEINLTNNHLAFTTDRWAENHSKRNFLTLNVHYLDELFNLKTNVLGTCELTTDTDIHDSVVDILSKFNIEDRLKSGVIVTDNRPDILTAFQNYNRLSCACHNLNLVMKDTLENSLIPELKMLIDDSKKLLHFFTKSGLNDQLTKPLKMENFDWCSIYKMLMDLAEVYIEIEQLLTTRNELHKIAFINPNLLQEVLNFLGPFKECSEQFSSEINPTIHQYVLWFEKLIKHCTKLTTTSNRTISELKVSTANALRKFLEPSPLHNVAIFLNPPYKKLKFMSEDKRMHTMTTIKTMLEERIQPKTYNHNVKMKKEMVDVKPFNFDIQKPQSSSFEYVSCSNSEDIDLFDEFKDEYDEDDNNVGIKEIDNELQIYLKRKVTHCNILDFWRDAVDLPLLRGLSKQILNIPVSATTVEKVFSTSAHTLTERRIQVIGENLDEILFLNKNL